MSLNQELGWPFLTQTYSGFGSDGGMQLTAINTVAIAASDPAMINSNFGVFIKPPQFNKAYRYCNTRSTY